MGSGVFFLIHSNASIQALEGVLRLPFASPDALTAQGIRTAAVSAVTTAAAAACRKVNLLAR